MSAEQKSRKASDRKYAVACFLSIYEVNTEAGIPEVRDKIESAYGGAKMYDHGGAMDVSCDDDEYQGIGEIVASEQIGLCPIGEGGACAERGETALGGRIPINPSGGLESKGHPIGATGLGQIFELVSQLRGECGPRQVENVRFALQENGGGLIGTEPAVIVMTVLGK